MIYDIICFGIWSLGFMSIVILGAEKCSTGNTCAAAKVFPAAECSTWNMRAAAEKLSRAGLFYVEQQLPCLQKNFGTPKFSL